MNQPPLLCGRAAAFIAWLQRSRVRGSEAQEYFLRVAPQLDQLGSQAISREPYW